MKTAIIFFALVAVALVAADPIIPIVEKSEVHDEAGQYALSYKSGDGTQVIEQGALKPNAEGDDLVLVKQGSFSYTGTDGKLYTTTYTADENGFHAKGDHIPV